MAFYDVTKDMFLSNSPEDFFNPRDKPRLPAFGIRNLFQDDTFVQRICSLGPTCTRRNHHLMSVLDKGVRQFADCALNSRTLVKIVEVEQEFHLIA